MATETVTISNRCELELPISSTLIEHMRDTKQMKYMAVDGAAYNLNVPLEYFEWIDENGEDCIVLLLSGKSTNPCKNKGLLIDTDFWQFLPKWRWSVTRNLDSFSVMVRAQSVSQLLSSFIKEFSGLNGHKFYQFRPGLDFRFRNLTTTNINRFAGKGSCGCSFVQLINGFESYYWSGIKQRHLGHFNTLAKAQQAYNAYIMELKLADDKNLDVFGRVFTSGKLEEMFPPKFYENGKLKAKYQAVLDDKPWLLAPITCETTQQEILAAGGTLDMVR